MTLRRVGLRRPAWLAGAFVFVASGGCSLFFDLNTTQCEVTSDCTSLGPQFSNTICVNRVCVERDPQGTGGSSGGNMGGGRGGGTSGGGENTGGSPDGGVSGGGKGGGPGMGGMGGASTGGTTGDGGVGGEAGSGGVPPECRTNLECIESHNDEAWICRNDKCVPVITDDCPVLLPATNTIALLAKSSPILLGGFATMNNEADYLDSQAVQNWDMALEEFAINTNGGVPSSGSTEPRPLMAVICKSNTMDVEPAMAHLGLELGVPAIISTLGVSSLYDAFSYTTKPAYTDAGGQPIFFLSTGSADLRMANLMDDGLVWHMLGNPRVLAATATAMVKRMEPFIHAQRVAHFNAVSGAEDPAVEPMRVTLVTSDEPTMLDVGTVLTEGDPEREETYLSFNGFPATAPENSKSFRRVEIESSRVHTGAPPDVSAGITELQTKPPHLVIAMATAEFAAQVIPTVETVNYWGKAGNATEKAMRPYYLVSQFLYNTNELRGTVGSFSTTVPPLERRLAGVNYAASQAPAAVRLYNNYLGRLQDHYNNRGMLSMAGTENYYDGAYSLIYSVVAALTTRSVLTAEDIRDALQNRVFLTSAPILEIGPSNVQTAMARLAVPTNRIQLYGTMGPPNFDSGSGTRISDTSAWCIQKVGSAWNYQADGLIYDPVNLRFNDPAPPVMVPACLQDYDP